MAPFFQLKPLRTYSPYANVAEIRQLSLTSKGNNTSLKNHVKQQRLKRGELKRGKGQKGKKENGKWKMGYRQGFPFRRGRCMHANC